MRPRGEASTNGMGALPVSYALVMENVENRLICVGQFGGSYAVQGWLKLQSFTEPDDAIFSYQPWFLSGQRQLELSAFRRHGRGFVVKLQGFDNPEQARTLAGQSIYVRREQLPDLSPGQYYWADLMGLDVENLTGHHIGQVSDMMETGANDVIVVKGTQDREILIPYVMDHYVKQIDLAAGKIIVDWEWDEQD